MKDKCWFCGKPEHEGSCPEEIENRVAPHGRCEKCHQPMRAEIDGADADGNRGITVYYCQNPECEECP